MGMFDSTFVEFACPACGVLPEKPVEVQFKTYIGKRYEPQCRVVELGEPLAGFPKIPVYEDQGCYCCTVCRHLPDVDLRFDHGILVSVSPSTEDSVWGELPEPRNARKLQQRQAFQQEVSRRQRAVGEKLRVGLEDEKQRSALAQALIVPIYRKMEYNRVARLALGVNPFPPNRVGPYVQDEFGKWKRA